MKSDAYETESAEAEPTYTATPPPASTAKVMVETIAYSPTPPQGGSIAVAGGSIGGYKRTVGPGQEGVAAPPETEEDRDWIRGIFKERGLWLEKELGRGTYGTVYLARDKNDAKVAVKVFHAEYNGGNKFKQEVDCLAQAEGALGVIGLKSIHIDEERYPYFVMQFASGGSLAKYTEGDKPASVSRVVRVFQRVVETIAYVHKEVTENKKVTKPPIIHCDLKPRNILLNSVGEPLIADFGLARLQREVGQALGTPFYMPPEQAAGGTKPEPAWDIYALGAILFELVTGRPPHYDPDLAKAIHANPPVGLEAYRRHLLDTPPPSDHWRGVDRRLAEIIDHCLQPDPARRMPDAAELLRKLKRREEWLAHRRIFVDLKKEDRGGTDNLAAYLAAHKTMPAKRAVPLFRQIVEAVQRAHGRGIRHQEIRPDNIVFRDMGNEDEESQTSSTFNPRPKPKPADSARGSSRSLGMNRSHVYFTAPERARPATPGPSQQLEQYLNDEANKDAGLDHPKFREDIYSLGVLLHTMLTGKPPRASDEFEGKLKDEGDVRKWMAAYADHVDANAAVAALESKDIDSELKALLADCLSLDARKRPQSTSEVIDRLDRRQHWRDNRGAFWKMVKIAATVFVVVGVVGYLLGLKSVEDARNRRYSQTLQAHREFLFSAEQTLNMRISNTIDYAEQMAKDFQEARIDGVPAIDYLRRNQNEVRSAGNPDSDIEAIKVYQRKTAQGLLPWFKMHYPPHVFNGSDVAQLGVMAVAKGADGTYRGYIVGRVEAAPWSLAREDSDYEKRFTLPPASLGRNFAFREYFHGGGQDSKEPAREVIRRTYISRVYQTSLIRPGTKDAHDQVMEIMTPVFADGADKAKDDPVALISSTIFFHPGIEADKTTVEGRRINRGYLSYSFDTETDSTFRRLLILDDRGYAVRHPERQIALANNKSSDPENDEASKERGKSINAVFDERRYDESWHAEFGPLDGPERSFPKLDPATGKPAAFDDRKLYLDPFMVKTDDRPARESVAMIKTFTPYEACDGFTKEEIAARPWFLAAYTPGDLANKPIEQAARDLRNIGIVVGSIFAIGFAFILAFLYFQLRYGDDAHAEVMRRLGRLRSRKPAIA